MPHAAPWSLALLLPLLGCVSPREDALPSAPDPVDASIATDVPTDLAPAVDAATPADVPTTDAPTTDARPADPCDLHTEVAVRLRDPVHVHRVLATLPAGTAIELLAVTATTRGPVERLGVLSRVRVRSTGAEGFVYLAAEAAQRCQQVGATAPDVRESRRVVVDGVEETWRVRFVTPSQEPAPLDGDVSCSGHFTARFDRGRAVLERLRHGVVIDRFDNPCRPSDGDECERGLLIPWRVGPQPGDPSPSSAEAPRLPWVTFLDLGDYDHDGRATELAMDVGHLVCGHSISVVVGITRANPRLHVLTWADGEPMELTVGRFAWDAVRASPRSEMVTWGCGDHASDTEERLRWWPTRRGLAHEELTTPMDEECHPLPDEETVREEGE